MVNDMTMCYSSEEATCICRYLSLLHWSMAEIPTTITTNKKTANPSIALNLAIVSPNFTLSPLPHLFGTPQTIQSCFTDKYEGVDRFVTFEDSRVTFIWGVCPLWNAKGGEVEWRRHLLSLKNTSSILWQILQMFCNPESSHKIKILCLEIVHPFQIFLQNLCNKSRSD